MWMHRQWLSLIYVVSFLLLGAPVSVQAEERSSRIQVQGYIQKSDIDTGNEIKPDQETNERSYILGESQGMLPNLSEQVLSYLVVLGLLVTTISFIFAGKGVDLDEDE